MSPLQRAALALLVAAIGCAVWMTRYEVIPSGGGNDGVASAYYLDRWTGVVYFMRGAVIYPVQPRIEASQ